MVESMMTATSRESARAGAHWALMGLAVASLVILAITLTGPETILQGPATASVTGSASGSASGPAAGLASGPAAGPVTAGATGAAGASVD